MWYVAPELGGQNTVHWHGWVWALCTIMVLFHESWSSRSCHLWRTYWCIPSCTIFCSDKIQYYQNSTLVMGKVGSLVNLTALLVGCLGGSVLNVDIDEAAKKKIPLQVLDCNWYLGGIFLIQVPVHCSYLVKLYPI